MFKMKITKSMVLKSKKYTVLIDEKSNNISMAVLKYLKPKEKRAELEAFGMINYAV